MDIKSSATSESNSSQYRSTSKLRALFRILSWEPVRVSVKDVVSSSNKTAASDNAVSPLPPATANSQRTGSQIEDSKRKSFAKNSKSILKQDFNLNKDPKCLSDPDFVISLKVTTVPLSVWDEAEKAARSDKNNTSKSILFNKSLTNQNIEKSIRLRIKSLIQIFDIKYEVSDVVNFDLDPQRFAIEATTGQNPGSANPKIVGYTPKQIIEVPGSSTRNFGKTSSNVISSSILKSMKDIRESIEEKDPGIADLKKKIKKSVKEISVGESLFTVESGDSNKDKDNVNPASEGVTFGNGLNSLKISKAYKNASKKIEYAMAPFNMQYSGWKPNVLGKYFASDSTKGIPTWVKSLGPAGDEMIKLAGSVAALKAFQYRIRASGIVDRLEKAGESAAKRKASQPIVASNTNNDTDRLINKIDRFTRR